MPTTLGALLVLLLALLPGKVGAFFLESVNGRDWRERDWQAVLRLLGVSVVGLAIYAIPAHFAGWPPPRHAIPSEVAAVTATTVVSLAIPYLGHIVGSALAGVGVALFLRLLARLEVFAYRATAWDTFARELVQKRWVVVTLKSGDVYAGSVHVADTGVAATERDLELRAPARYDWKTRNYKRDAYRDLFIPAALVDSIATVAEPDEMPPVGPSPFIEANHEQSTTTHAPTDANGQN